jgi:hypothetical protein
MSLILGDAPGLRLMNAINLVMVSAFLIDGFSEGLNQVLDWNMKPEKMRKLF